MDFAFDSTTVELRERLLAFMDEHVYPAEERFREEVAEATDPWARPPVIEELKGEARARGLWNLFLPAAHEHGAGLTNLQYAPLAEITGRNPWIAPEALNCSAPDTGNMELLSLFGRAEQKARWLEPLLEGDDPLGVLDDRAGGRVLGRDQHRDAHRARRRRLRHQRAQVVDVGRDVAALRAADRDGRHRPRRRAPPAPEHDPRARRTRRACSVVRSTSLFGYDDGPHGGHAEIVYDNVRVPASNLLGEEGDGFRLAQERLGPGRIHHAMRAIGMAERALEMMCSGPPSARRSGGRSSTTASCSGGSPRRA